MATTATMLDSTSSPSTNGSPIFPTEVMAVDGRPVEPPWEANSSIEKASNDSQLIFSQPLQLRSHVSAKLPPPPESSRPESPIERKVSRILWPAVRSASYMVTTKLNGAAEPPSPLIEVINANNTNAQQALAPGLPDSSNSPSSPESFALKTMPSADWYGLNDPSAFKTPANPTSPNLSKPPPLIRGRKRYRSDDEEEMSPTTRHRMEKRRVRSIICGE